MIAERSWNPPTRSLNRAMRHRLGIVDLITLKLAQNRTQAIDVVYDTLDTLLLTKKFKEAEEVLRALASDELPLVILASGLAASRAWAEHLGSAREALVRRAQERARQEGKLTSIDRFT